MIVFKKNKVTKPKVFDSVDKNNVVRVGLFLPVDAYASLKFESAKLQVSMSQFVALMLVRSKEEKQ